MGNAPEELEDRIERLERSVYGDDDSSLGLSARMHMTETTLTKIDATLGKLNWLIIAGVVVGVLNLVINRAPSASLPTPQHQTTSVNVGDAEADLKNVSARTWLTTQEVAKREGVTDHTITNYIAARQIEPPPEKDGKSYRIAEHYRILPKDAETCGTAETQSN